MDGWYSVNVVKRWSKFHGWMEQFALVTWDRHGRGRAFGMYNSEAEALDAAANLEHLKAQQMSGVRR